MVESNPWDEFIRRAKASVVSGSLKAGEIDYKVDIFEEIEAAREAVLKGTDDWPNLLTKALKPNHPISWRILAHFRGWYTKNSEVALSALQGLWAKETENNSSLAERIRTFANKLPPEAARGGSVGVRTTIVSALLMGLGVEKYPWYQTQAFHKIYKLTRYGNPQSGADEAALYIHALGFLDQLIEEAEKRGLRLRHRLDAQGVVWMSKYPEFWNLPDSEEKVSQITLSPSSPLPDLKSLAEELYLTEPNDFLQEIKALLEDKKQVIFQGPPGTGKTYVAQALAKYLAGSEGRVTLVQFHPSYAYEDFVRGFRPKVSEDGQAGFELKDGPLLQAAERAKKESDERHFLIIDEINRGNLAKVFGELYFLLEYRDEEITLQYQRDADEGKFSLPENLYVIGTMNTADRSIALVDLALRRRFYFVEFHPDEEPVRGVLRRWLEAKAMTEVMWVADVVERANELLKDDRHAAIGPSYFMKDGLDDAMIERIWKHSVLPYIEERRFGGDEVSDDFNLDKLKAGVQADSGSADGGDDADNQDGGVNDASD